MSFLLTYDERVALTSIDRGACKLVEAGADAREDSAGGVLLG
jgi:hypothetical protein